VYENLFDLSGKVAVVTGASDGLGKAIAIGLAAFGADIAGADIAMDGLKQTMAQAHSLGRKAIAVTCDISNPEQVHQLFQRVDEEYRQIDILVNNAGIIIRRRPEEMTVEEWEKVLKINATGTFLCSQEAGKRMIARGKGGRIINISSTTSCTAMGRGNFVYSISKSAINQMTRELAIEWASHNINVNAVMPAQIRTAYLQRLIDDPNFDSKSLLDKLHGGIPLNRLGEMDDVVGPVVFLASEAAKFVTGITLPVDGGNLAFNACGSKTW
jgi:NAD(P)-dependent dehydrogenase (short-subunit alcohol dehydrogenase family)